MVIKWAACCSRFNKSDYWYYVKQPPTNLLNSLIHLSPGDFTMYLISPPLLKWTDIYTKTGAALNEQ